MHKGGQHWRNSQRRKEIEKIDSRKAAESYGLDSIWSGNTYMHGMRNKGNSQDAMLDAVKARIKKYRGA